MQITVNNTTVDSASATFDYANNLGPNPTIVLPFTTVNLPALTNMSMPNPPGWQLPWPTPFVYVAVPGMHFCWEWRHLNASDFSNAAMDAVSGYSASTLPSEGTGCTTMGQSRPATITSRSLNLITGAYRQQMRYGAANAPAVLAIGVQRVNLQLPGQCAPLLVNPLTFVSGGLDGAGEWDFNVNFPTPIGGSGNLLAQFVWVDPGLALNLGLSDMSVLDMPLRGSRFMIRLYTAPYQGGAGFETATMATGSTRSYGLVTGFLLP